MRDEKFSLNHAYVLVKQVPDSSKIEVDPENGSLLRSSAGSIPNPADADALAAYVALKKCVPTLRGKVLTMGPKSARSSLREALALGVDEAYHLEDKAFAGSDVYATAYALTQAIKNLGLPQLILCGEKSEDSETGQVPGEVAELLGFSYVDKVTAIAAADSENGRLTVWQERTNERRLVEVPLPLVLVTKTATFPPCYANMREKRAAKALPIHQIGLADLGDTNPAHYGYQASPTRVKKLFAPSSRRQRLRLEKWSQDWWQEQVKEAELLQRERLKSSISSTKMGTRSRADFCFVHTGKAQLTLELVAAVESLVDNTYLRVLMAQEEETEQLEKYVDEIVRFSGASSVWDSGDVLMPEKAISEKTENSCQDSDSEELQVLVGISRYLETECNATDAVLIPADDLGLSIAPRLAARLRLGLTACCTDFTWQGGKLQQIRPAYGDRLLASIESVTQPALATVRPGQFLAKTEANKQTSWIDRTVPGIPATNRILKRLPIEAGEELDQASVVLVLGNGINEEKDFRRLITWAASQGWGWRVTRPLVKGGWAPPERQVGVSGSSIKADVALLLGISGSRQTMEGLKHVGRLVAINTNPDAAVFDQVDVGYVGQWQEIFGEENNAEKI